MKKTVFFALVALALGSTTQMAGAAEPMAFVGGLLGIGMFNNNGGTQVAVGANAGYKLVPNLSAGLEFTYSPLGGVSVPGAAVTGGGGSEYVILVNLLYHFDEYVLKGAHAGLKLGWGHTSTSDATITITGLPTQNVPGTGNSAFTIGGNAGYDYMMGGDISVGGDANFLVLTTSGNATTELQILASAKYWF